MRKEKIEVSNLSAERQWIFNHTMEKLDSEYDEEAHLIGSPESHHGVRTSAHYALGLLARGGDGDIKRGCAVISALLKLQFEAEETDAYYGVFRRNDGEPAPPKAKFPGAHFTPSARFCLDQWQETICNDFSRGLSVNGFSGEEVKVIQNLLEQSVLRTIPVIWKSYDPNWREFIGSIFALALCLFEEALPGELVTAMEAAMEQSVTGSISRYKKNIHPMNTNVELMHIFICDYYGKRLNRNDFSIHGLEAAKRFWSRYGEFHTVSEFNSPTYYGVDLMCVSLWKQFAPTELIGTMGAQLEEELWRELGQFYNPELYNVCGPFSRSYEMDMQIHTALPSYLYIGLGAAMAEKPLDNSEMAGNIDMALLGTCIPEDIREDFVKHSGDRMVERHYRELIERGAPDCSNPLCTATSWIRKDYMLGGLAGSQNTSGQLRPASAFWKAPDQSVSYLALLRRAPWRGCNEHHRTVFLNGTVTRDHMAIEVEFRVNRDMELYFEIIGAGVEASQIEAGCWRLPGMTIAVEERAPVPDVRSVAGGVEVVYAYKYWENQEKTMSFQLHFQKTENSKR